MTYPQITFIGAGNMASALIGGLLARGIPGSAVHAADPDEIKTRNLAERYGIKTFTDNIEAVRNAGVIILAVKPQAMKTVCLSLAPGLSGHPLIISIAAGIRCTSLLQWLGQPSIIRCMPNTPALLLQGATGLYAAPSVTGEQRHLAEQLLSSVGMTVWVDRESQLDAVTAVSGSGPAYFFLLLEAMIDAGEKLGLSKEIAEQLAVQTARGAVAMAATQDKDIATLRKEVTSPAGTTEAAINVFLSGKFPALAEQALQAAAYRSAELSEQLGK